MGFFSSIINFIKEVVQAVVDVIADIVGSVFGNSPFVPVILALAALAVVVWVSGPALIADILATTPWDLLEFFPSLCAYAANAVVAIVTLVAPDFGRALGFVQGILTFAMFLPTMATMAGWQNSWTSEKVFNTLFGVFKLSAEQMALIFMEYSTFTVVSFVTQATGGSGSAFLQGWVDGFFAIPILAAEGADAAVDAALGSAAGIGALLLLGLGAYLAFSSSKAQQVRQNFFGIVPETVEGRA